MTELAPHRGYTDRLAASIEGTAGAAGAESAEGTVPFQRCDDCRAAVFYPRTLCPACGSTRLSWSRSAGLGTVYSASVLSPRDGLPYPVVLVDLDEGFRMMSTVVGVPADEVRIGTRVRARVEPDGPRVVFTVLAAEGDDEEEA
ncbi:OB-fold domain-containing protein [Streptosporangium sp. NPDC051023]|uniref:Zn-ribbon domain-containing OB-fold protein n=1 Tax=Streptosporangium sp. NPDC051023 TaxID=3155410 RepID=UPI00344F35D2